MWVKEMLQLISMCRAHDDELRTLMYWEWGESRTVLFMEFTRCMDHPATMAAAIGRKSQQYDEAVEAIWLAQQTLNYSARTVAEVSTIPMVFGVRGAMAYAEACEGFK